MNVSKNSWHYKLMQGWHSTDDAIPANLCQYVRSLCGFLLLCGLLIAVSLFLASSVVVFVYGLLTGSIGNEEHPLYAMFIAGFITLFFATVLALCVGLRIAFGKLRRLRYNAPAKEDSLIVEYIKAKHNKICPRIDFKE